MSMRESGDELWEEFVKEFEKNNAVREPSAAERARRPVRRNARRRLLLPVAAALLVAAGAAASLLRPSDPDPAPAAAAPPAPTAAAAPPSSAPSPHAATPSIGAPSAASDGPTSAIPLSVFPAQVQGYTLVADVAHPSCTGPDTVAPTLAGLITQGHGCLGVDLALYKDAEGNQYNLALFTMKDPGDSVHLVTLLGSHPEAYEVAVHIPPTDSGLSRLPADSGLVQGFASYGHGMLIGMAQWSDGRTADFDKLSKQLSPLTEAVINNVPA
ncbi:MULTISPECIES: hypothetical protein [unclassified Kitasatospora]|uniref:hypothetical protein n=1 Tax=unclassified Kitasatospora TaxID=2633591 RepID=UPI00340CA3AF